MRVKMTAVAGLATLLSSIALYPLFVGGGWFWSGLGAVLSVALAGLLVRRFRLPATINLLAGLAALNLYLTMRYTSAEAFLGIIPTAGSVTRLAELLGDGWTAANRYAAPVPQVPGISLLATGGIGLVAAFVDLIAVRLRRAAPAGLPLLAMYSVPAAVREESVSWIAFGLGAAGFMALLLTDAREQVGVWGRPVLTRRWSDSTPRERPDPAALSMTGRRIGFAAVALAVLVPALVPGIHQRGLLGMGGGGGGGGGPQTVTTPDPLVSLQRQLSQQSDAVVLKYTTDDQARPDYLRLYALDQFDGDRWTYTSLPSTTKDRIRDKVLPAPPGLGNAAPTRAVTTKVEVDDKVKKMTFLPVPYAPSQVDIKGDWRAHTPSLMVYSLRDSAGGREYTVRSLRTEPTPAQLAQGGNYSRDVPAPYTRVPSQVPQEVHKLADQVTKGADTAYAQAERLQRWFTVTGGFTYDLTARPPKNGNDLLDFLVGSKRGYCEQFAASMALMARTLGIPARVAMGYTAGSRGEDNEWIVRARDAHAWPELYFEGVGWVRFEPTPSGPTGQGSAATPSWAQPAAIGGSPEEQAQASALPPGAQTPEPSFSANPRVGPRADEAGGIDSVAGPLDQRRDDRAPVGWLAAATLLALLLVTPMVARRLSRRRRWRAVRPVPAGERPRFRPAARSAKVITDPAAAAHAAWREMRADAIDYGLAWRPSDSPRAAAHRLTELLELGAEPAEAMGRLAHAEERASYARSPVPADGLRSDVRTVRDAFATSVGPLTRWRARLAPPSTIASMRGLGGRALEAWDHFDALLARLATPQNPER